MPVTSPTMRRAMRSVFKLISRGFEKVFTRRAGNRIPLVVAVALVIPGSVALPGFSEAQMRAESRQGALETWHSGIVPILEKHCYECHGDGYDKGKVAFDRLETDEQILQPDLWV